MSCLFAIPEDLSFFTNKEPSEPLFSQVFLLYPVPVIKQFLVSSV